MSPAAAASGAMTSAQWLLGTNVPSSREIGQAHARVRLRPRLLINKPVPCRLGHGVMVRA
jgi:hypothetical protein